MTTPKTGAKDRWSQNAVVTILVIAFLLGSPEAPDTNG